ncbi:MAG: DUF2489 domain-containing protein [Gammaproteobacteria bacterium]|nr:DUF2489 domain-containing protein [Gammaproteobacteria bacterium]
MNQDWLFGGMAAVVLVLAVVAARLWWQVGRQQRRIRALQAQQAQKEMERIDYIYTSLNLIARAVLDDQCPVTEGCIRMAVLLDNLSLDCDTRQRFSPVFEIYHATRHIPTHSRWNALERKQQRRFEQEMRSLELRSGAAVQELMQFVRDNPFGQRLGNTLN